MIVSANQPYFAPYPGFFHKAWLSDCLVLLDDVQFPRKTTWITRNRFKNDQGMLWMTIPVYKKGLGLQKISQVRVCPGGNWKRKHLQSFKSAYARAPFLSDLLGAIERIYSRHHDRVLDLNLELIHYILDYLGIDIRVVLMSALAVSGKGTRLIIDICKSLGAQKFMVQSSAMAYYDADRFEAEGLELVAFKKPDYVYPQLWGDFIANLSVLDMMLTCGPKSRDLIFT